MNSGFNLDRFVEAQEPTFNIALAELRSGWKKTHWMWFIFPQPRVLGRSATAKFYGIRSVDEALAYLRHPILGQRLIEATAAVIESPAASLHELFGSPDDLKFRSCMTLFHAASRMDVFRLAIERRCGGEYDPLTIEALARLASRDR